MPSVPQSEHGFIAIYGSVAIEKGYCRECRDYSFVVDGKLVCCDTPPSSPPRSYHRVSTSGRIATRLTKAQREAKLKQQNYRCCYCLRPFGNVVIRRTRQIVLKWEWDHFVPVAYARDNSTDNFVAACQVCNSLKSARCFDTWEEAHAYLREKWVSKGIVDADAE